MFKNLKRSLDLAKYNIKVLGLFNVRTFEDKEKEEAEELSNEKYEDWIHFCRSGYTSKYGLLLGTSVTCSHCNEKHMREYKVDNDAIKMTVTCSNCNKLCIVGISLPVIYSFVSAKNTITVNNNGIDVNFHTLTHGLPNV